MLALLSNTNMPDRMSDHLRTGNLHGLGSLITSLADAIQQQEGWFPGSVAYRNNNPGNLRDQWVGDRWYIWPQYPHDTAGFTIFPDYGTGRAALERDLNIKISRGMTLRDIIYAWAPAGYEGNDPGTYLAHVQQWTGLPTDTPLNAGGPGGTGESGSIISAVIHWLGIPGEGGNGEEPNPGLPATETEISIPAAMVALGVVAIIWAVV